MSFEEEFPSLKGILYRDDDSDIAQVLIHDVLKHCLDKAKVKKAIESFNKEFQSASIRLKKEFGLE